jgi:hypothetical protein
VGIEGTPHRHAIQYGKLKIIALLGEQLPAPTPQEAGKRTGKGCKAALHRKVNLLSRAEKGGKHWNFACLA